MSRRAMLKPTGPTPRQRGGQTLDRIRCETCDGAKLDSPQQKASQLSGGVLAERGWLERLAMLMALSH